MGVGASTGRQGRGSVEVRAARRLDNQQVNNVSLVPTQQGGMCAGREGAESEREGRERYRTGRAKPDMVAGWIFCDLVVFRASGAQQQQKRAEAREREKSVRAAPLFISLSRCPTHLHPPARPLSAASHTRHSYSYCCFVAHTHTHRTLSLVLEPVFAGLLNVTALPLPLRPWLRSHTR